ncbi:D-aspartate oxidase-like isoform X2 [Bradysia coprophila]|uniref:D-aspartate oxidase-like isoform X2 n=1 Tax=Bradysia coprophila TaxID=38358 RepID=UPI00187D9F8B|nr:D-aspartate oxidase-like isoform X2 [Bradysia coprophila]XP_037037220.1 D-aspartate oxidase-like isoform X2 [Bradysia coprophila]
MKKDIPHVLIIGAGVSGLTTAWVLLDRGYKITVIAAKYASKDEKITSQIAGALWEWPPPVCGRYWHWEDICLDNLKRRCLVSFHRFNTLADNPETGVRMCKSNLFFGRPIQSCPAQTRKLAEIKETLPGFRHDIKIVEELGANPDYGIVDSYCHLAPIIDSDQYMDWLINYLKSRDNIKFFTREIKGNLLAQECELLTYYEADMIVNCTGINAKELVGDDTVFSLRGAYFRMINDGSKFRKINEAMMVTLDGEESNDMIFIVPRNNNTVILGAIGEREVLDLNINLENYPPLKKMLERDLAFYPDLKNGEFDPDYPIAIGIRPFRRTHVQLGRERKDSRIVHNYGHGDSGYTLSFGCAEDVADIIDEMSKEIFIKKENVPTISKNMCNGSSINYVTQEGKGV